MIAALGACLLMSATQPEPFGAIPSAAQLAWHNKPYYCLIHFGPNTFTDQEWGHGTENPDIFNPTQLDCRQWARSIKAAGMAGAILVAKHHDGFCLWPTDTTTHSVKQSKWGGGKRDVIGEMSAACKEQGLKFAVYLSPWDRNHPAYGSGEAYNEIYRRQVKELTTRYGPFFMFWVDGANGEGPNGKKQVYDWPSFFGTILKHQPRAVIFSDVGPGARWVGNEQGWAGETNWATVDTRGLTPGNNKASEVNPSGQMGAPNWIPAECDTPLRPGWFYHADQDDKVRSLENLIETWCNSVGRGASLNLGLAPDRRGLIHENDAARLKEFADWRETSFAKDLLKGAWAQGFGEYEGYEASRMLDSDPSTFYAVRQGSSWHMVKFMLDKAVEINAVEVREHIALGQRVQSFEVDAWLDGEWKRVALGTTIGPRRLLQFPLVKTNRIRVLINKTLALPCLDGVSAYRMLTADEYRSKVGKGAT
jgi:alpha-L-fucosidase